MSILKTCIGRKANGTLCGRAYPPEPGDTGRCPDCRARHQAAVRARKAKQHWQSPAWRRARVADDHCAVPGCETPERRVARHHLVPAPEGSDDPVNQLPLCVHDHNAYEAQKRAGRTTELTRFVDGIRDQRIARYGRRMYRRTEAAT